MKEIIDILTEKNKTIATMESCTGGSLAGEITNVIGASQVFKYGAITYSNESKIKMGVDSKIIDKFTVYSIETANSMSKTISGYANSDYGVGITGKINNQDISNLEGKENTIFISIYDRKSDKFYEYYLDVKSSSRIENKEYIINKVIVFLKNIIN